MYKSDDLAEIHILPGIPEITNSDGCDNLTLDSL